MVSSTLELAGFAVLAIATFIGAGIVAGLAVAGGELLLIGYAVDDAELALSMRRAAAPLRARAARARDARRAKRAARTLAKA